MTENPPEQPPGNDREPGPELVESPERIEQGRETADTRPPVPWSATPVDAGPAELPDQEPIDPADTLAAVPRIEPDPAAAQVAPGEPAPASEVTEHAPAEPVLTEHAPAEPVLTEQDPGQPVLTEQDPGQPVLTEHGPDESSVAEAPGVGLPTPGREGGTDRPASASAGPGVAETTPAPPMPIPARTSRPGRPGPGRGRAAQVGAAQSPTNPPGESTVEPVDPRQWGRIDVDGTVYVYSASGERPVGNWQAGDDEAGLIHFGRRFDDFLTEISLLETRLATGSGDPKATKAHAIDLRESVDTLAAVGDFDSAAARLETVIGAADVALAGASQARAAARTRAIAAKEVLCAEAEQLAESTSWKTSGDRLKAIVEEWRTIHGIDRRTDDALWKRFAKARDTFTRHRGTHFADMDKQRTAAREVKDKLIAQAEALSGSDEWGKTAGEFRQLMEEWKASGRAPREVEDELWARFRAAQESFFARRNKTFSERDTEFETNAAVKEKLLDEAEKIDPVRGADAARSALRSIQERWEAAGKVPRERIRDFDTRLRAVEDRIKKAEDSHWRRTDPETVARIEQFRSRAEGYRAQEAKARASGDDRRAAQAQAQAVQWEEWLAAAQGAAG